MDKSHAQKMVKGLIRRYGFTTSDLFGESFVTLPSPKDYSEVDDFVPQGNNPIPNVVSRPQPRGLLQQAQADIGVMGGITKTIPVISGGNIVAERLRPISSIGGQLSRRIPELNRRIWGR